MNEELLGDIEVLSMDHYPIQLKEYKRLQHKQGRQSCCQANEIGLIGI
jgi:hypothetical protein